MIRKSLRFNSVLLKKPVSSATTYTHKMATSSTAASYATVPKPKIYSVTGSSQSGAASEFTTPKSGTIKVENGNPSPIDYAITSLVACEIATARFLAKKMGMEVGSITFTKVEGAVDFSNFTNVGAAPCTINSIEIEVEVETNESQERVAALQHGVEDRCPVYTVYKNGGVKINAVWTKKEPASSKL